MFIDNAYSGGGIFAVNCISQQPCGEYVLDSLSTLNISGTGLYINNTAGDCGGVVHAAGYSTIHMLSINDLGSDIVLDGMSIMANSTAGSTGGAVSVMYGILQSIKLDP